MMMMMIYLYIYIVPGDLASLSEKKDSFFNHIFTLYPHPYIYIIIIIIVFVYSTHFPLSGLDCDDLSITIKFGTLFYDRMPLMMPIYLAGL